MATPTPASIPARLDRYPIGGPHQQASSLDRSAHLEHIRALPLLFSTAFKDLDDGQLDTPYREGGWTLRQLAHHVCDSHLNVWLRLKLALTEDWPTIKPYDEKLWALTAENSMPVATSLALLVPLHARMFSLLSGLNTAEWDRGIIHPENGRISVAELVPHYSWHGRHHTAHVTRLRERRGW